MNLIPDGIPDDYIIKIVELKIHNKNDIILK